RTGSAAPAPRQIWLFPGQGSQYPGMAAALWREEPDFRAALEPLLAVADSIDGELRTLLLDADPGDDEAAARLAQTARSQPALFLVSYAMARTLEAYGLRADAMIGHSIGEYVAACLAGVFSPEQTLKLVARRGALMQAQPPGDMVAVHATVEALRPHLTADIEIACYNAEALQVVSGSHQAMQAQLAELEKHELRHSRLKVSHAFHSLLMEGALPAFTEAVAAATPAAPQRTFYACSHGQPITAGQSVDPAYWAGQIRAPVRFADSLRHALAEDRPAMLLEVGPGRALSTLARTPGGASGHRPRAVVAFGATVDAKDGDGDLVFARALGESWVQGADVDLEHRYAGETRGHVPLPGYPFRRDHYGYTAPSAHATTPQLSSTPGTPPSATDSHGGDATAAIVALLAEVSGEPVGSIDPARNFVALGLDSLLLTQFTLALEQRLGLKLRFRRLLEDLNTPESLAAHARAELPAETWAAPAPATPAPQPGTTITTTSDPDGIQALLASQLQMLEQQTQLLRGLAGVTPPGQPALRAVAPATSQAPAADEPTAGSSRTHSAGFGASARINLEHGAELEPEQQRWLDDFIGRYTRHTSASRSFTQRHRQVMADPRVVTGFDPRWKEMVYPIVVDRSRGARLWDINGNEYIDLLNGFGSNFLGYQPPFIAEALQAQIAGGYEIGPQHPLAAEVSELIAGFTGLPRVAFCNTGSEAVMGAMRIARTVTGRDTIAIFRDSYHGIFDEAVVRGTSRFEARPAAPGIIPGAVQHMLVLDYGSDEALNILRQRSSELAAIMIEPIQARHPELRPKAFIEALRTISDQAGCALIFDEVITGFRIEPGGAQAYFDIKADIATYGKIIGGGLPFAAIAGQSRWMDALDGGDWRFGDDSQPEAGVTYFAGTFVRHPLALAAASAALKHLEQAGPALQESLNQRTAQLTERLNRHFRKRRAPIEAVSFSSMWRLRVDDDQTLASLLFYLLRYRGLHLYEQFGCFLSDAHGETEITEIAERIERSVDELLDLKLLHPRGQDTEPAPTSTAPVPPQKEVNVAVEQGSASSAPMTAGQLEKWVVCQYGEKALLSYNEGVLLNLEGKLDRNALRSALEDLWTRHEALRISIDGARENQSVSDCALPFEEVDLGGADDSGAGQAARLAAWSREQMVTPFDLATAPLLRIHLLRLNHEAHVLHLVGHHLVLDGWSLAVFVRELAVCYNARRAGREPDLPPASSFLAYARNEKARREKSGAELDYWQRELADAPEALALGHGDEGDSHLSFDADTFQHDFPAASLAAVRKRAGMASVTPFSVLMSAFAILLWRLSGERDLVLCIPFAGQAMVGADNMIGDGVNTLPLRIRIDPAENLSQLLKRVHTQLLDAADHQDTTLLSIARCLNERRSRGGRSLSRIIFNLNPHIAPPHFEGLDVSMRDCRRSYCAWDLFFNFYDTGSELTLDLHYDCTQFDPDSLGQWMTTYAALLDGMRGNADPAVRDLATAGESFELTEAQREMCAATLMGDDANCAFNECFMLTLQGPLSPESLRNALIEVVQRHGALRLRIDLRMERQILLPAVEIDLPVIDLRAEDETVRRATIEQLLDHETHTPFDFSVAPLWRALLIREADDRHRFIFTAHHLVVDGWSSAVIFSDLARSYAADRFGLASSLPPAAPYGEFVRKQLGPEVAAEMEAATQYWVNRFSGGVPTLELPVDAPRPAVKTYAAARQVLAIDKELYQALRKLAAQQRATLFVALLAAFEVLLARLGSADELVIGVPMASQALQDNEHLVAHGVNTLPLLCRVDPRLSFKDHLQSTHNEFLEAQTHQRLTFGTLVRKLRLPRDPSRTPLVSVIFNMNKLCNPFDFGDVSVASVDAPNAFYNFEMGINVIDDGESLFLECDYNVDIFKATTINRWLSHYRELLSGIVRNPQARLSELPLLDGEERAQLAGGAAIAQIAVQHTSLHEGFEKQVARAPDAIALTCGTEQNRVELSYAELNRRADALAEHLRGLGVGPDQLVGLRCERNAELVVAILGILKAGGAYLPMDPVYPAERIAFMLRDADVRIVLTQRCLAGELADLDVICLCLDEPLPSPLSDPPAVVSGSAQSLAYVMYTSGSTGRPKGVRITHHNVLRLFAATDSWFDFQPDDVWTLFHSYAFDASVFELWGALLYGGRVVVVPQDVSRDPRVFRELLVREAVTVLSQTPTAFLQLIDIDRTLPPGDYVLRYVILGGEALKLQSLKPWMDRYGDQTPRLINMYGITETTVHTTYRRIFRADLEGHAGSVIGAPIPDLCVYLLDAYGEPVPLGVPGEVYVAGAGVAAGYLNRPELTAQRFLPDPFQPRDDAGVPARMYRSGDLARRLDNGELEYLGRMDHQVKIRGFRIELGEIEACLTGHPAVREATVLALGEDADKRLVA
ncbi:MAG: amino acid adenylation domain-containing protein, partial [Gammaproteobacteria bacterium]